MEDITNEKLSNDNNRVDGFANNADAEELKAFLLEEKPTLKRGDKKKELINGEVVKAVIRNVYSRRLEDVTFSDLEMMGYTNPNIFVKEWTEGHGSFDKGQKVWIIVYVDEVAAIKDSESKFIKQDK